MPDYTNCFSCIGCGKSLPMGIEKCPICGYDYIDIKKSNKQLFYAKMYIGVCVIWFFATIGIMDIPKIRHFLNDLGSITFAMIPIIVGYFLYQKRIIAKANSDKWKVDYYNKFIQESNKNDFEYVDPKKYWDNAEIPSNWLSKLLNSEDDNVKF